MLAQFCIAVLLLTVAASTCVFVEYKLLYFIFFVAAYAVIQGFGIKEGIPFGEIWGF